MGKKRQTRYSAKKRSYAGRIVRLCAAVTGKSISDECAEAIGEYIIDKLPKALMRRLVRGDYGLPMREAMKLTAPFLAQ